MSEIARCMAVAGLMCGCLAGSAAAAGPPRPLGLPMTPVSPCRVLDTRPGSGAPNQITGPLAAGVIYGVDVVGRCGVPPEARAAVLNVIAVGPAGPGHLNAWPWEDGPSPPPSASILNYAALGGLNIANSVDLPLCDPTTIADADCDFDLFLQPAVSSTHVVIDVTGYYALRVWGEGRPGAKVWPWMMFGQAPQYCQHNGIQFGLSGMEASWDGAAAACPRGWWVCTRADRGSQVPCDTMRPDNGSFADHFDCERNSVHWDPDAHVGWLADSTGESGNGELAYAMRETGETVQNNGCHRYTVWCCR